MNRSYLKPAWRTILLAIPFLAFLWLSIFLTAVAVPAAKIDDRLFATQAYAIAHGQWLGSYDMLTLSKGPFYAIFAALAYRLHIPLMVAQNTAYAAAAAWLAYAVLRLTCSRKLAAIALLVILFNPVTFTGLLTRVTREGIYVPLTMGIVATAILLLADRRAGPGIRAGWAILLGLLAGALWITREEGVWIVPTLCLLGMMLIASRRNNAWLIVVVLMAASLPVGGVMAMNWRHYREATIVDFKQDVFVTAYASLSRIKPDIDTPYVSVPRSTLKKLFAVSPAAAELAPVFNGPAAANYATIGCRMYRIEPCDGELRNAFLMWSFREAVSDAGHYRSPQAARAYYDQLTAEIDAACRDARLDCIPPRSSMVPPFQWRFVPDTFHSLANIVRYVAIMDDLWWEHDIVLSCDTAPPDSPCATDAAYFSLLRGQPFAPGWVGESTPDIDAWQQRSTSDVRIRLAFINQTAVHGLVVLYQTAVPWCLLAACLCYGLAALRALRRGLGPRVPIFAAATLCLLAIITRCLLLAFVDATAIPTINPQYLSNVYPLMLLFCVLAMAMVWPGGWSSAADGYDIPGAGSNSNGA